MSEIHVSQTNQPPSEPPRRTDGDHSIWPAVIVILVVVVLVLAFIFMRGGAPPERTEIDINLPETSAPEIKVPERIEVDLPEKVEVEVQPPQQQPATPKAPPPQP